MARENVGTISVEMVVNSREFENKVKSVIKNTEKEAIKSGTGVESAFGSSMKKIGSLVAGAFAVTQVVSFTKSAVNAASKIQSAWTGLNSIVQGTGNSFSQAQNFIKEFTKDGLLTVEETATAYKNLLSRGYDTTQIENTLTALKDSAAFGRQASYDLGEAVVAATEGLKNENSILVDNAGVTKNVAKMWEEWAREHNTTTSAMTQAQKIQAEYNGIMKETKFQTGDAAVYTKTFGGQVQMLKASFTSMQIAIGKVVAPIAQLFIPVINSAINAITGLFNKIQLVLKTFGLEMPDVVSKASSSISNVTSSASSAAKEINGTGDSAVKAAKKINKAFGSVDEINVLSSSKGDSANSAGSSNVGNSVSISPTVATDDAVSNAVSGTVDKIKRFIEPLQNINFDNLVNAFSNLMNALKPFGSKIASGLEWLYFNVLIPLGQFAVEDVIPNFFNILSSSIGIVSSILEGFKPLGSWLWESFLNPIATWTGGVVGATISIIADALQKISDWCNNNQSVIDKMVTTLTIFFGLWEVTKLLAFIQMSGGLVSAFTLLTSSIWACTGAKIADKLETIAITALYAKDFIVSVAQGTAALVKQAGQWAISTGLKIADTTATVAATAATWLFNAALAVLTSPITLVVLAIGALIAIIILCVKHWDDIKEAASACWENIKSVWNKVSEWFNNTIVQPIKNFFGGMWDGLKNGASQAWEGIKSIFSNVTNWFKDVFTKAWEGVKKVFSTGGKIFSGIKDGIASVFKTVVNAIISGINKVIAVPFNAINGLLNKIRGISIMGVEPFKSLIKYNPLAVPQIPKLANGGYVGANNPQLAIIGDNTREGEIVTPESKIYEQVSKAMRENNNGTKEIAITIYHKYEDGKTIIQKINQAQIDAGQVLLLS